MPRPRAPWILRRKSAAQLVESTAVDSTSNDDAPRLPGAKRPAAAVKLNSSRMGTPIRTSTNITAVAYMLTHRSA